MSEKTETKNETDISITVTIVEGQQIRIGKLVLAGNERFSEAEIRDQLSLRQGKLFTPVALEQGIERIQTLYSEYGYPKVEIAPKDFQFSAEDRDCRFSVEYPRRCRGPDW